MSSLTPGQMVIKIVNEELTTLMGSETTELKLLPDNQITVITVSYTHLDVYKRQD